mgnify:CR=1 FL=1
MGGFREVAERIECNLKCLVIEFIFRIDIHNGLKRAIWRKHEAR